MTSTIYSGPNFLRDRLLSSVPASSSLSSLSLNPANVAGGNSSTGTVTLSGAASTGGAQVALSSNNGQLAYLRA